MGWFFLSKVSKATEAIHSCGPIKLGSSLVLQHGILLVCYFLIFAPSLPALYNDWFQFKQFSHGLLVPFIAGYMAWQKRKELQATAQKTSVWGVCLIVPALGLSLIGKAIGDPFSERMGMILCL